MPDYKRTNGTILCTLQLYCRNNVIPGERFTAAAVATVIIILHLTVARLNRAGGASEN